MESYINRQKSILILAGTVILLIAAGSLIGYSFFWNQYDQSSSSQKKAAQLEEQTLVKPADTTNQIELGWTYYDQGKYAEAQELFARLFKQDDKNADAKYGLANAYLGLKQYESAGKLLIELSEAIPEDDRILQDLGIAQREQGLYKEAEESLNKALAINKMSADLHYDIALVYEKLDNKESAIDHFKKCVDFVPDFTAARDGLKRLGMESYEPKKFH